MGFQFGGDVGGKGVAVNGKGTAGRQAMRLGCGEDQAMSGAHFPMQKADGVLLIIVRAEGIRTDHLGEIAGAVGEGFHLGPHLVQDHGDAHLRRLPGGLGPGHAAADDVKGFAHGVDLGCFGADEKCQMRGLAGVLPVSCLCLPQRKTKGRAKLSRPA